MERKIGEIFEYKGEWYQCLVENDYYRCKDDCLFYNKEYDLCDEESPECIDYKRSDNTNVIFKKLEKVGEPVLYGLRVSQRYKVYAPVILPEDQHGLYMSYNLIDNMLYIEIKQNQEDMEEKELNLKEFNLEAAKAGKPVCTRDGRKARIICFDVKAKKPIAALITNDDTEEVHFYYDNGRSDQYQEYRYDLMMLPEKKERWVNVYKDSVYDTKDEALIGRSEIRGYIDTIKISWEE